MSGALFGAEIVGATSVTVPVTVSVSGASVAPVVVSTGVSVMVSLYVPLEPPPSVTAGAASALPAATPAKAVKPALVKSLEPEMAKLPDSGSAGAAALLSTPSEIVVGASMLPRFSV